jgi:hypothetical protein
MHCDWKLKLRSCNGSYGFTEVVTKGGNRIGEVMASMLASSVVDRGFEPHRVKPKNIKLAFVAFPLITQLKGVRSKTGWLRIRIMCPSVVTCLSVESCFSGELAL